MVENYIHLCNGTDSDDVGKQVFQTKFAKIGVGEDSPPFRYLHLLSFSFSSYDTLWKKKRIQWFNKLRVADIKKAKFFALAL